MRRNTNEDFWGRVDQTGGPDACWPWTGRRKPSGHGCYDHDGTWSYAHRRAYVLTFGEPVDFVLHRCDNAPCCNPRHLYDGDQAQNVRDRDERGRRIAPMGEDHGNARLSDAEADAILSAYRTGRYSQKQLGRLFSVHFSTVSNIARGKRKRRDGSIDN